MNMLTVKSPDVGTLSNRPSQAQTVRSSLSIGGRAVLKKGPALNSMTESTAANGGNNGGNASQLVAFAITYPGAKVVRSGNSRRDFALVGSELEAVAIVRGLR